MQCMLIECTINIHINIHTFMYELSEMRIKMCWINAEHFNLMKFHWFFSIQSDSDKTYTQSLVHMPLGSGGGGVMKTNIECIYKRNQVEKNHPYIVIGDHNLVLVTAQLNFLYQPSNQPTTQVFIHLKYIASHSLNLLLNYSIYIVTCYTLYLLSLFVECNTLVCK